MRDIFDGIIDLLSSTVNNGQLGPRLYSWCVDTSEYSLVLTKIVQKLVFAK